MDRGTRNLLRFLFLFLFFAAPLQAAADRYDLILWGGTAFDYTSSIGLTGTYEANPTMSQSRASQAVQMGAMTGMVWLVGKYTLKGHPKARKVLFGIVGGVHFGCGAWNHSLRLRGH